MNAEFKQLRFLVDTINAKDEIIKTQQEALEFYREQLEDVLIKQKETEKIIEKLNSKLN